MSFIKFTTFKVEDNDWKIISATELEKTASFIPDGFKYDPDYLYLRVKAVSAGEFWGENKNNDYFPEDELKENYRTFLTAHTFKNHENKKIEGAIGDVLSAEWNDKMKAVYLVIRVDRKIAPSVVRGYEKRFMTDVSMGCRVSHVVCSYCNKEAKTRFDYCEHLKYMKGKVMENGKKVYEINIAPKFHDISAVLNGAERTAKVEGILINGDKVSLALDKSDTVQINKTAFSSINSANFIKEASDNSKANKGVDKSVSATSSLKNNLKKENITADINVAKSNLTEKVLAKSIDDFTNNSINAMEELSEVIKLNYTKYMTKPECIKIAKEIKAIAKRHLISPKNVLIQFLNVIKYSLIELSPVELNDIVFEVLGRDTFDYRQLKTNDGVHGLNKTTEVLDNLKLNNVGSCIEVIDKLKDKLDLAGPTSDTVNKLKIIIMKNKAPNVGTDMEHEIMSNIVSGLLPERSAHRRFIIPRLVRISNGEIPTCNSSAHFSTPRLILTKQLRRESMDGILSSLLSAAHYGDRESSLNDNSISSGLIKFAHIFQDSGFEKCARVKKYIKPGKVALSGIPLTFGYSALQRARINNGEPVSSVNRYIAENPASASLVSTLGLKWAAPSLNKGISNAVKAGPKVKTVGADLADKAKNMYKDTVLDKFIKNKKADEDFNIDIVKQAAVLDEMGKEDLRDELLFAHGLNFGNIDEYLKMASSYYTIELEKEASGFLKNVAAGIGGDFLLNNVKKGSNLASLPGYVADGVLFASLGKGIQKLTEPKKNIKNLNNNIQN